MDRLLSVVIPAYNEADMIPAASEAIAAVLERERIPYELLFVNDGSTDATWQEIEAEAERSDRVRGLCLSRNFGKESAISAGLAAARGACAAVIDCDLQHPPEKLLDMYRLWEQGYEVIEGVKANRGTEGRLHRLAAKCFYSLISAATRIDMLRASDFKLLDRKAVDALLSMPERNAFFRALSAWVGFRTASVEFEVQARATGRSRWSAWGLFKYALTNLASFSAAPLQLVTFLGILMLCVSVALGVVALYQKFAGTALGGFTTVIILQLFIGSIIMISLGIIGYYIAKIYDEIKARPRYILSGTCGKGADGGADRPRRGRSL